MRAGSLRHRLSVDSPTTTQTPDGNTTTSWQYQRDVDAQIEPIGGREALRAGQIIADMDTRITLRWSPFADTIEATWRFRYRNEIYNIVRKPAEKLLGRREIEFTCQSGQNLG